MCRDAGIGSLAIHARTSGLRGSHMGTLNPSTSVSAGLIATPWKAIKKSPIAVDTQQGSCELFSAKLNKS